MESLWSRNWGWRDDRRQMSVSGSQVYHGTTFFKKDIHRHTYTVIFKQCMFVGHSIYGKYHSAKVFLCSFVRWIFYSYLVMLVQHEVVMNQVHTKRLVFLTVNEPNICSGITLGTGNVRDRFKYLNISSDKLCSHSFTSIILVTIHINK